MSTAAVLTHIRGLLVYDRIMEEDESPAFWAQKSPDDLAAVAAEMHRQRRAWHGETLEREVQAARRAVGEMFLRGRGIEVGAGPRPFPIPKAATCDYGDIRDAQSSGSTSTAPAVRSPPRLTRRR